MFRFAKNAAAALALSGLVLSQPALAVRSYESLPSASAKAGAVDRVGSARTSESLVGVPTFGFVLAALIAAGVLIVVVSDNKNHHQSPG